MSKQENEIKPENGKAKTAHTGILKFLQHLFITLAAVAALLLISRSAIIISRFGGKELHTQFKSDAGRKYEDSVLFNTILGYETTDVLRLVTIRTQMETDGVYDPDKVIDVLAYNARQSETYETGQEGRVKYYLGDLLKWKRYGLYTEPAESRTVFASGNSAYGPDGGDSGYYTEYDYTDVLVNRYKTVDGLGLESYATNGFEYGRLVEELNMCCDDLYTNYSDYLKLTEYFDVINSNIRYCVIMGDGKDRTVYTNAGISADTDNARIAEAFRSYGRYLCYDFDRMMYQTNTAITESTFNNLMYNYKYAYPDDCVIYIGVDMDMPVNDCIKSASANYTTVIPAQNELFIAIIASLFLYLVLLVLCTILEGKAVDADGRNYIRFTVFDNTPIELWGLLTGGFLGLCLATYYFIKSEDREVLYEVANYNNIPYIAAAAAAVFILDVIFLFLYYSFIRRVKGRHIWKQSLLYKILGSIKKGIYFVYDNGGLLLRSVVPYVIFLVINALTIVAGYFVRESGFAVCALITLILVDILVGIFIYKQANDRSKIIDGMKRIITGDLTYKADGNGMHGDNKELSECINSISDSVRNAVEQSMKDERMKTELVANVSHDIRTPLTSIINYVDLIKRENIEDETVRGYIQVLDEKSQRLKTLTDDLIEASKVSSGNVDLELVKMNLPEMLSQALGEFSDKFDERQLSIVTRTEGLTNPNMMADGRYLWRVIENLLGNVCKYSMPGTRVFVDLFNIPAGTYGTAGSEKEKVALRITNMSSTPLPEDLSELTERFIRGDESRTGEGSGLGLSIAKTLTELMGGTFTLAGEADLFKAEISFEAVN